MNLEYEPYYISIKLGEKYKSEKENINKFGDTLVELYSILTENSSDLPFGKFEKMTSGINKAGPDWAVLKFHPEIDFEDPLPKAMTHLRSLGLEAEVMDSNKVINLEE